MNFMVAAKLDEEQLCVLQQLSRRDCLKLQTRSHSFDLKNDL